MKGKLFIETSGLLTVVVFGILIINITLINVDIETQPMIVLFGAFVLFLFRIRSKVGVDSNEIICLLWLFVLTIYLFWSFFFIGTQSVIAYIKYIIGPFCFFSIYPYTDKYNSNVLVYFLISCFLVGISLLLGISPVAGVYKAFADFFLVRQYDNFDLGVRGLSFFSAEPSYAAILFGFVIFLLERERCYLRVSKRKYTILLLMCFLLTILTKALMGYLILFLFCLVRFKAYIFKLRSACLVVLFIISFLFVHQNLQIKRFLEISHSLEKSNVVEKIDNNLKEGMIALALAMPSTSTRFITNLIGILGVIDRPMGHGLGAYPLEWFNTADKYDMYWLSQQYSLSKQYLKHGRTNAQTYLFNVLYDVGVFSIVIFLYFTVNLLKHYFLTRFNYIKFGVLFVLLSLFFQGQMSNPLFWIVMAFIFNDMKLKQDDTL